MVKRRRFNRSNIFNDKIGGRVTCNGGFLPFRSNVFGSVSSFTVMQNLNDLIQGVYEIKRTGKNDLKFAISILKKKADKIDLIKDLRTHLDGIKSVSINNDLLEEIAELREEIIQKRDVFIQNSFITEVRDIEDYFFHN